MTASPELWGVETAAQELAQRVVRSLPVTVASVALWDHPSLSLTVKGVSTRHPLATPLPVGARVPLVSARCHRAVFERQEPVFLDQDSITDAMPAEEVELALIPNLHSIYLLPIVVDDELVGVLGLGEMRHQEREPFTEAKRQRCRTVLDEFLAASAHAWEASRLRRQVRAMSSLLRIVAQTTEARTFQDVLASLGSEVADWLGTAVRGILFRTDPTRGVAVVGRWPLPNPLTEEDEAQVLLALARSEQRGQWPVSIVNVADDPLDPFHSGVERAGPWTRVGLPLIRGDQLMGVACLYVEEELRPTQWELEAFRRRAEIAAVGIDILATLQEQQREREWLERTAYELMTTHQRVVLREALTGVMQLVSSNLPARLERATSEQVLPGEGLGWHALAELIAREVTDVLTELRDSDGHELEKPSVPLEVNELVRRAVEIARPKWAEGQDHRQGPIELHFQPSTEPLVAETSLALVGALIHAIEHAAETMPGGGRIHVRTARENGHVVISVRDAGPGVPQELRAETLAPLLAPEPKPNLGRGLSMVRAFAARHGGEATLAQEESGGTTLLLRLPTTRAAT